MPLALYYQNSPSVSAHCTMPRFEITEYMDNSLFSFFYLNGEGGLLHKIPILLALTKGMRPFKIVPILVA